jgi:hypothetical protein
MREMSQIVRIDQPTGFVIVRFLPILFDFQSRCQKSEPVESIESPRI